MQLNYEKRKNNELFRSFRSNDTMSIDEIQNYIPLYSRFFSLNAKNYDTINLNNKWHIDALYEKSRENDNIYKCRLQHHTTGATRKDTVFFKLAPLIDPFKYLLGKYDASDPCLYKLPILTASTDVHPKMNDVNNSAYIDSFFSYLTSQLNDVHKIVHSVKYYGSFLAIKNDYKLNIADDIDYLSESDYFNQQKNVGFKVDDYSHLFSSQHQRVPLTIGDDYGIIDVQDINEQCEPESPCITLEDLKEMSFDVNMVGHKSDFASIRSSSTCSSRTSHTSLTKGDCDCDGECTGKCKKDEGVVSHEKCEGSEESESWETSSGVSVVSDFIINVTIPKFPVQVICMEKCDETLDDLLHRTEMSQAEWFSALMQIVMTLIIYQKAFNFTHNDLHSNNVMIVKTSIPFIYYVQGRKFYKVPTFGRIFKIIDFGRSIYKFGGHTFCSDSFQSGADAATQYNTEPYFNNKKPRLDPNFSFDICRLACSLFDYLISDMEDVDEDKLDPVAALIHEWCLDDKGVNILYKTNGEERYPDFKLYKMIARCVHNHTPLAQLERTTFQQYEILKKDVPTNSPVVNIDNIPSWKNALK